MIFTVEPMINLGRPQVKILSDGWTAVTRDRSLSAQYEHSVGVTETGVEIFTVSPKGRPPTVHERLSTTRAADLPHFLGHRERLKTRFRELGAERLADYELLELILFQVVPRRDTKPIAKALLSRFGSFSEVLARAGGAASARSRASARRSPFTSR